jgi:hypothetical protein
MAMLPVLPSPEDGDEIRSHHMAVAPGFVGMFVMSEMGPVPRNDVRSVY